jgi:uncharacterized protein YgiM (DUF1202 family)
MRTLLPVALLIALVAGEARADRHTTEAVVLRKKPGEKEPAVAKVPANTRVVVLAEDGRWLKVRAMGRVGYVTRTTISDSEPVAAKNPTPVDRGGADDRPAGDRPAVDRPAGDRPAVVRDHDTPTWSAARHPGGAGAEVTDMFIEVTAPAALLKAPTEKSDRIVEVARGAHLVVIDAASMPGWIHAHDDSGHDGWIARTQVDNGASAVAVTGVDLQGISLTREGGFTRPTRGGLVIRTDVAIGYRSLAMDFTSNAEGGLTNYLVDASAMAAIVHVDIAKRIAGTVFVAADARLEVSAASPGLNYPGPTGPPGMIPFKTFGGDVGARVGLHLNDAIDVAVRGGGHYDAFLPDDVNNVGMLPRERLLGVTVGLRAEFAPRHSRFAATVRGDVMVIGDRSQTHGLEDGTSSAATALWGGLAFRYVLREHWAVFAAYDFGRATTHWTGMSVRQPTVTDAHRVDTAQTLQLGITAEM